MLRGPFQQHNEVILSYLSISMPDEYSLAQQNRAEICLNPGVSCLLISAQQDRPEICLKTGGASGTNPSNVSESKLWRRGYLKGQIKTFDDQDIDATVDRTLTALRLVG